MRAFFSFMGGSSPLAGGLFAAAAFGLWGGFPVYFKAVAAADPAEVLAHRIFWSVVFVAVLLAAARRFGAVRKAFADRRCLLALAGSAVLVTINWGVFIWAVSIGEILQSSLGYYINPLVSVFLGVVFLGERLARTQWLAIALAATGVGVMVVQVGVVPWIALALAFSFAGYGLIRKLAPVDALTGLFVETLLMAPFAAAYLIYLWGAGGLSFGAAGWGFSALLALAGVITALPLILFAAGARRLRLSSIGLFQYIAPTGHFLLAVLVYGETFTATHATTFGLIWLALGLYSLAGLRRRAVVEPI